MMIEPTYTYEPYEYSNAWGEGYVSPTEMVGDYGAEYNYDWGGGYASPTEMVKDYGWEYNNGEIESNAKYGYWAEDIVMKMSPTMYEPPDNSEKANAKYGWWAEDIVMKMSPTMYEPPDNSE